MLVCQCDDTCIFNACFNIEIALDINVVIFLCYSKPNKNTYIVLYTPKLKLKYHIAAKVMLEYDKNEESKKK